MKVKCGYCMKEADMEIMIIQQDKSHKRTSQLRCPNCFRILPSSRIVYEDNKHIHYEWQEGDILV